MKPAAANQASETTSPEPAPTPYPAPDAELRLFEGNRTDPLSECVRTALRFYLDNMDGHAVVGLHALVMEEVERPLFETVLDHTQGNLSEAARMLGLTRATLRKRLCHYGVARER